MAFGKTSRRHRGPPSLLAAAGVRDPCRGERLLGGEPRGVPGLVLGGGTGVRMAAR